MINVKYDKVSQGEFRDERIVTIKTLEGEEVVYSYWVGGKHSNINLKKGTVDMILLDSNELRITSPQDYYRWRGPASFRIDKSKILSEVIS